MKTTITAALFVLILVFSCKKIEDQQFTVKFYGDAYEDIGYSVSIVSDGYVIAGQLTNLTRSGNYISSSDKNMGVIKTGWDGNVIWKTSAGGKRPDWGSKLYGNDDGSFICIGTYTDSTTVVQTDLFIVKISTTGDIVWQKHYGGSGNQTGKDLVKTSDGFLVLCSTDLANLTADSTGNKAGNRDMIFMKISENGDSLSASQAWGYSGNDDGVAIKQANDGNYFVFGTTDRSEPGQNQDKNNLILLKVNSSGLALQTRIIGTTADEYAADFEVVSDGYILTYTIGQDGDNQEIWVEKLTNDIYAAPAFAGHKITITDPVTATETSAKAYAISKYGTDSFVLAGIAGKTGAAKMLVFEMDASGNQVAGHQVIQGSTGVQFAYDVTSGDDGYVIAVGKNSYDVNSMITFLKFKF